MAHPAQRWIMELPENPCAGFIRIGQPQRQCPTKVFAAQVLIPFLEDSETDEENMKQQVATAQFVLAACRAKAKREENAVPGLKQYPWDGEE